MGKRIEHEGVIDSINGNHIRVKISQMSACSSCQVKSMCSTSESKDKIIDIYTPLFHHFKVGETVLACGSRSMGRNAVILAFVLPLFLMVVWTIISNYVLSLSEQMTLVGIFILLAVYYLVVKLFDGRLKNKFSFWIEKIQQ